MFRITGCGFALFLAASSTVSGSLVVFQDTEFSPSDYTTEIEMSGTASSVATHESSGGNPGAFVKFTNTLGLNSGVLNRQYNIHFVYDPSTQGAVTSAMGSFDAVSFPAGPGLPMIGVGLTARQNGLAFSTTSVNVSSDDTPGFQPLVYPDLVSALPGINWINGGPIEFAIYAQNGSSTVAYTKTGGIDNFRIEINAVPEPGSGVFMAMLLSIVVSRPNRRPARSRIQLFTQ